MDTLSIQKLDENQLPELQGFKERQLAVVEANPFLEITDAKTYEEAKKRRTTLKTARTEIEKQDKIIVRKINDFKDFAKKISQDLISISKPHEEKQQEEINRWEEAKEQERQKKIREEEERKEGIRAKIASLITDEEMALSKATIQDIDELYKSWEEGLFQTDTAQFEEFAIDFVKDVNYLKEKFNVKADQLKADEARRLEDERLKAEREELDRQRKEMAEQQRIANEKLKAEQDRIAKEQKAEADRLKAEQEALKKKQEEAQAIIDEQNRKIAEENQRIADEKAAKEAEEAAKKEAERLKKEKAAALKAAAALKPEKEKLTAFANSLNFSDEEPAIENPELNKAKAAFIERVSELKTKFINHINTL